MNNVLKYTLSLEHMNKSIPCRVYIRINYTLFNFFTHAIKVCSIYRLFMEVFIGDTVLL